jgi:hypothetical protein
MANVEYMKTYTAFSGSDIVATFNNQVIGELLGITYNVTREKAPMYTLGSVDPRGFTRGKRGIAGQLAFRVFDGDALMQAMKKANNNKVYGWGAYGMAMSSQVSNPLAIEEWNSKLTELLKTPEKDKDQKWLDSVSVLTRTIGALNHVFNAGLTGSQGTSLTHGYDAEYVDQIPPFDVTLSFLNEYGQSAVLNIYGVEILNEGSSFTIDDVSTERAMTYVARSISQMRKAEAK